MRSKTCLGIERLWMPFFLLIIGCATIESTGCAVIERDQYGRPIIPENLERTRIVQDSAGTDIGRIHYCTEGPHASTEHHVDMIEEGLREGWEYLFKSGEIGLWPSPAADGNRGGDGLFDVYVHNSYELQNGTTSRDDNVYPSALFVEIKSNPVGLLLFSSEAKRDLFRKVTTVHELSHVGQQGYLYHGETMWTEGGAVFVTNELYDIVNTLEEFNNPMTEGFLSAWPRNSLWTQESSLYQEYAPFVPYFFTEYFDDKTILLEIYQKAAVHRAALHCGGYDCLVKGLDDVLTSRGEIYDEMVQRLTEWNYMTCKNDDGRHYQWNREKCPDVSVAINASYGPGNYPETPVAVSAPEWLNPSSSHYFVFQTDTSDAKVFGLDVPDAEAGPTSMGISIIRKLPGGVAYDLDRLEEERYLFQSGSTQEFVIPDWDQYEEIIVVVQNLRREIEAAWASSVEYSYRLASPQE